MDVEYGEGGPKGGQEGRTQGPGLEVLIRGSQCLAGRGQSEVNFAFDCAKEYCELRQIGFFFGGGAMFFGSPFGQGRPTPLQLCALLLLSCFVQTRKTE